MVNFKKALLILEDDFTCDINTFKATLAFAKQNNVALDFICVLPELASTNYSNSSKTEETVIEGVTQRIQHEISTFDKEIQYSLNVVMGIMPAIVIDEVLKNKYDLVIKQSEDPSWLDSIFGNDDLDLIRKCPCAVWLIHESVNEHYKTIVAAVDFSEDEGELEEELNMRIASNAAAFCVYNKAQMHVVSAYNASKSGYESMWASNRDEFERKVLLEEERKRRFSSMYLIDKMKKNNSDSNIQALSVKQHIIEGQAVTTIPAKVVELGADLVVMGTLGRSGMIGMLIGNTAESVLRKLTCSVLILKPYDY